MTSPSEKRDEMGVVNVIRCWTIMSGGACLAKSRFI